MLNYLTANDFFVQIRHVWKTIVDGLGLRRITMLYLPTRVRKRLNNLLTCMDRKVQDWTIFMNNEYICTVPAMNGSFSRQGFASSASRSGLRSANSSLYVTPRLRTKFGERAFSHAGPAAWNSLPVEIRDLTDSSTFRKKLKTHFFNIAYA